MRECKHLLGRLLSQGMLKARVDLKALSWEKSVALSALIPARRFCPDSYRYHWVRELAPRISAQLEGAPSRVRIRASSTHLQHCFKKGPKAPDMLLVFT